MLKRTALLIAAASVIAGCNQPEDNGRVRSEIDARNKELGAAFARGDYNAVAGMYSSSAQLFPPNAPPVSSHDGIVGMWKGFVEAGFKGLELTANEVEAAKDHADEEGSYRLVGADGSTVDTGKYIVIWKKENDKWVLHRDIWNSNNPPMPPPAVAPAAAPAAGAPDAAPSAAAPPADAPKAQSVPPGT